MEREELISIINIADELPYEALARLFIKLESDLPSRQAAIECWKNNKDAYENRTRKIRAALQHSNITTLTPAIQPVEAFAFLRALDEHLASLNFFESKASVLKTQGGSIYVHQRPEGWRCGYTHQPLHTQYWMRNHWVFLNMVDGVEVMFDTGNPKDGLGQSALHESLKRVIAGGQLRIYVCGFLDKVGLVNECEPPYYRFSGLNDIESRWKSVEEALNAANASQAHVLVLPELTVCACLRRRVQDWLSRTMHTLLFVIPGSFHFDIEGKHIGEAVLLDNFGDVLLRHHKLQPEIIDGKAIEYIEPASHLTVLPTEVGLIALGICLDFCQDLPSMNALWNQLGPSLVFVPSMSNKATRTAHHRRAKDLLRNHGTITAVAIQPEPVNEVAKKSRKYGLVVGHFNDQVDLQKKKNPTEKWVQIEQSSGRNVCGKCVVLKIGPYHQ